MGAVPAATERVPRADPRGLGLESDDQLLLGTRVGVQGVQ
jgi:hypothetical protein